MRSWRIMLGPALALIGLQAVQAQVTIDITKITCDQYLAGELTDANTLSKWLSGYVNGERAQRVPEVCSAGMHYRKSDLHQTNATKCCLGSFAGTNT